MLLEGQIDQTHQLSARLLPTTTAPAMPGATPAAAMEPRGTMRQRIVALLRDYPEGLSPAQTRQRLGVEKDFGSTMKAMMRDGLRRRVQLGRYTATDEECTNEQCTREETLMYRRRLLRVRSLVLLAGLPWGCHTAANTGTPTAEEQRPTLQEQQAQLEHMDCYTLGVFAFQVAQARDTTGLTKEEALSTVAQGLTQRLQTTTTPDEVTATGTRLSAVVDRVYRSPGWTPEGAALQILTRCLEQYAQPH